MCCRRCFWPVPPFTVVVLICVVFFTIVLINRYSDDKDSSSFVVGFLVLHTSTATKHRPFKPKRMYAWLLLALWLYAFVCCCCLLIVVYCCLLLAVCCCLLVVVLCCSLFAVC